VTIKRQELWFRPVFESAASEYYLCRAINCHAEDFGVPLGNVGLQYVESLIRMDGVDVVFDYDC